MDDTRGFPILGERSERDRRCKHQPSTIPWWLAEIACREYCRRYGTDRGMEQMAERGGLGRTELVSLLRGCNGYDVNSKRDVDA